MENKINLIHTTNAKELEDIKSFLTQQGIITDSENLFIGTVNDIRIRDCKTREGNQFQQIEIELKSSDGKTFIKRWSVDFTRKYFNQIGHKSEEVFGCVVVFKQKDKFRNVSFFAFVDEYETDTDYIYNIVPYVDELTDFKEQLKKLGL